MAAVNHDLLCSPERTHGSRVSTGARGCRGAADREVLQAER